MVLMGLVTGVPCFVAGKPSVEDGTLVMCLSEAVFPVAMWRPPSRALSVVCQESGKFPRPF